MGALMKTAHKVVTERDRGFAVERATQLVRQGWHVTQGPTKCRSGKFKRNSKRRLTYWRMELAR